MNGIGAKRPPDSIDSSAMDATSEDRPSKRPRLSPGPISTATEENPQAQNGSAKVPEDQQNKANVEKILAKEQEVGIVAFVNQARPVFLGLLKKRYTDFLVNEIDPDGKVVHLTSLRVGGKTKGEPEKASPEAAEEPNHGEMNENENSEFDLEQSHANGQPKTEDQSSQPMISSEDRATLVEHLGEKAVDDLIALDLAASQEPKKKSRDYGTVRTQFTSDRTVRGQIHGNIRRIFKSRIESSTGKDGVLILTVANRQGKSGKQNRGGKLSWVERGGEHCHFSLYKENKDTMETISFLAYLLKKAPRDFEFAGTKDRRAATVQRVSCWRMESERLSGLNRHSSLKTAALGDFEYRQTGLRLGDLSGNEFVLTIRDYSLHAGDQTHVEPHQVRESLMSSLSDLHTKGFLNYYGLQRFGTFAIRSDVIGLKILSGDYKGACDLILDYNPSFLEEADTDNPSTTSRIGRDDLGRAQAISTFRTTNSIKDALSLLPKRFSAEFNIIRTLGKNKNDHLHALLAIQRNLRNMYIHAYQSRVWNMAVTSRWQLYGDSVVAGDLVLMDEHKDKEVGGGATKSEVVDADGEIIVHAGEDDRANAADDIFERARALTAGEAASGQYSIFDLVMPLPGYDILYPANESGEFYSTFMKSDEGGKLDPMDMRRAQRDFSLSGSYRKVMARIGEDFDINVHQHIHEDEQFVKTDLEKIRGTPDAKESTLAQDDIAVDKGEAAKLAVVVKLQLGTSQYATIALRELSRSGIVEYKPDFSGGR